MPWPIVRLGDVAEVKSGYPFKSESWVEAGVPVIKIANVKNGNLEMDGCSFVAEEVAEEAQEFRTKPGDILIAMTGYVGDVALVRSNEHMLVNQRVGKFIIKNPEVLDLGFFFSFLRSPATRRELEGRGYGSAQPNISPSLIHGIEMPLPAIGDQRRIAHILGSLDDKIELNRRMNETLELTARAIFQSWLVDFDPVLAKAEGRQPFGMDSVTAALFPDSFDESEMGQIPKGWGVMPLDNIANFLNGLALQKYPPEGDHYLPVIKIADMRRGNTEGSDRASADLPSEYVVHDGDVLFSWSGSLEVMLWCGGDGALNQHLFKVTSDEFPKWFYYLWTRHHLAEFQAIAAGKATTMGHIQRHHLSDAKVVVPPTPLLEKMSMTFAPLVDAQIRNNLESRTLISLRDTLLPKLLSGELSLSHT